MILSPRRHLAVSGGSLSCHSKDGVTRSERAGMADRQPTVHNTLPPEQRMTPAPNNNNIGAEKRPVGGEHDPLKE